jgi:hypothetical protein
VAIESVEAVPAGESAVATGVNTVIFTTDSIEEAVPLGSRVPVMTAGPGPVKAVVAVELRPDGTDEDIQSSGDRPGRPRRTVVPPRGRGHHCGLTRSGPIRTA